MIQLDRIDLKIIEALRKNARLSNQDLADRAGTSPSSCWRRVRALEDAGVLAGYHASLDAAAIGLPETVFVHISLTQHTPENLALFDDLIARTPQILDCFAITGDYDYLLKVVARDMRSYHRFLRDRILRQPYISRAMTNVTMERLKETHGLPAEIIPANDVSKA